MDSKEIEPPTGPGQDHVGILCFTLIGICIMLALRMPLNNYITVVVVIAQLICRVRSQQRRKKRQLRKATPSERAREPDERLAGRAPETPYENLNDGDPTASGQRAGSHERGNRVMMRR